MDTSAIQNVPPAEAVGVDKHQLRKVFGHFVTGVTIVTSLAEDHPVGLTVNSFTSVSLDPPLVLFCVHRMSRIWPAVRSAGMFVVNILAADQAEICRDFATKESAHFVGVSSRTGQTGVQILKDALAYVECSLYSVIDAGDHFVVLGQVLDLGVQRNEGPLTFFRNQHPRLEGQ